MRRAWSSIVCLTLLLSLSLSACGGSGHGASGTLRVPIYGGFDIPDPAGAHSTSDLFVDSLLYSGLLKFSPDLHVIPELAVSLPTISSNGLTYTFTIRQDARFADGHQCTAWDIAYSLGRALQVGGPDARHALGGIRGASLVEDGIEAIPHGLQVVGRLSLRIHLTSPDADFLQRLAFPVASVVDRRVIPRTPLRAWPSRPAGTGAWIVSSRASNGSITLVRRPHSVGSLQLRRLTLVPVRDATEGLSLYRKGGLDVAAVPAASVERLSGNPELRQSNALAGYYAVPTVGNGLQLAAALDRDALVRDAGMGLVPLDTIVPASVPDYVSSSPAIAVTPDPSLESAGASISLEYPADPVMQSLKRALARQWSVHAAGSVLHARIEYDAHLLPDPGSWLRLVLPQTRSRWFRNSLRSAQQLTNDPVDRMNTYDTCERWALEKGLIVPLAMDTVAYLLKPAVQGIQVTPAGIMPDNNNWALVAVT